MAYFPTFTTKKSTICKDMYHTLILWEQVKLNVKRSLGYVWVSCGFISPSVILALVVTKVAIVHKQSARLSFL